MNIKAIAVFGTFMLGGLLSACATTSNGAAWNCTANNIVAGHYNGGEYAYIQLQGFEYGGNYAVTQDGNKTRATGKTKNGTLFECRKQ